MPYSIDSDVNRENPHSPSSHMSIQEQLIYKIASLDSAVTNGFRRLDENFDRIRSEIHDRHIEIAAALIKLENETDARFNTKRQRIDKLERETITNLEREISAIKTWQQVLTARFSVAIAAVVVSWAVFGQTVQDFFGRIFN